MDRNESRRETFRNDGCRVTDRDRNIHEVAYAHGHKQGRDDLQNELGLYDRAEFLVSDPGYQKLVKVFGKAHDHAARGKGKERHANDLPFEQQRMLGIARGLKDPVASLAYQVIKKTTEGLGMADPARIEAELLGAINYLAGMVILLGERPVPPSTDNGHAISPTVEVASETPSTLADAFRAMSASEQDEFVRIMGLR